MEKVVELNINESLNILKERVRDKLGKLLYSHFANHNSNSFASKVKYTFPFILANDKCPNSLYDYFMNKRVSDHLDVIAVKNNLSIDTIDKLSMYTNDIHILTSLLRFENITKSTKETILMKIKLLQK